MWHGFEGLGYVTGAFTGFVGWAASIWFVVFSILVVVKLSRIVNLLEKK